MDPIDAFECSNCQTTHYDCNCVCPNQDQDMPKIIENKELQQVLTSTDVTKHQIDVTAPQTVEILIRKDGKVIWINVEGVCMFRACQIKYLEVYDQRVKKG